MQVDSVNRDSAASRIGALFGVNAFSSSDSPQPAANRAETNITGSKPACHLQPQTAHTPQPAASVGANVQAKEVRKELRTPDAASMGLAVLFGCQPRSASLPQTAAVIKIVQEPLNREGQKEQNPVAANPVNTRVEPSDSEDTFAGWDSAHCDKNTSRPFVLDPLLVEWLNDSGLNTKSVKEAFCRERIDCELLALMTHDQLQDLGVKKVSQCSLFASAARCCSTYQRKYSVQKKIRCAEREAGRNEC